MKRDVPKSDKKRGYVLSSSAMYVTGPREKKGEKGTIARGLTHADSNPRPRFALSPRLTPPQTHLHVSLPPTLTQVFSS